MEREREKEREEQRRAEKQAESQLRQNEKTEWLKREAELMQSLKDLKQRLEEKKQTPDEATRRLLVDMRATIQKLTKDKSELRQSLLSLEEAVDLYRRNESERVEAERDEQAALWAKDKAELQLAVKTKEEEKRQWEEDANNGYKDARCYYDFFIRSEGFRKSLAFQKRFLLVRLGGFQDCEKAALTLLSNMGAVSDSRMGARSHHPRSRLRKVMFAVLAIARLRLLAAKWRHYGYPQSRLLVSQHPLYRPGKGRRFLDDFASQRDGVASSVFPRDPRCGTTMSNGGSLEIRRFNENPMVLQPPERESRSAFTSATTSLTMEPSVSLFRASQSAPITSFNAGRSQNLQRSQPVVQSDPALEAYIRRLDDLRARISSRTKGRGSQY